VSTNGIVSTGGTVVDLGGSTSLTANGGITILAFTNTYTGATTINSGATAVGGTANAFSTASATTVNIGGFLDLGGVAQTINTVSLAGGTLQKRIADRRRNVQRRQHHWPRRDRHGHHHGRNDVHERNEPLYRRDKP